MEASESTRLRIKEALPKYHEDHIAGRGAIHCNIAIWYTFSYVWMGCALQNAFFGIQKMFLTFSEVKWSHQLFHCSWHFGRSNEAKVGFNGRRTKKAAKAAERSSTQNKKSSTKKQKQNTKQSKKVQAELKKKSATTTEKVQTTSRTSSSKLHKLLHKQH